jgi:Asp-tRNA(Asn)/Glu-tRNA(Gln) amidotransferase A subunit family amidase
LLGVPLAHKDMFVGTGSSAGAAGGLLPSCGSRVREVVALLAAERHGAGVVAHPPAATVLGRLEAAGAQAIGALNMAEFALGATGHNAAFGDCRNAWQPEFVAGGSSSGSGAPSPTASGASGTATPTLSAVGTPTPTPTGSFSESATPSAGVGALHHRGSCSACLGVACRRGQRQLD